MQLPAIRLRRFAFVLTALLCTAAAQAEESDDVALITVVEGNVARAASLHGPKPVPAFVKLKSGDRLTLAAARVQIVYFESGRQETWRGDGRLEIGTGASKATGLPEPEARTLPDIMVKQIAKTPTLDSQGRAGAVRLRGLPSPATVEKILATYRQLRDWAEANDLNPELFLLSALFEQRDVERIQQVLADLPVKRPNDAQVDQVVALYRKLIEASR
ncbi:MAG: hypothetical protein ACM3Y9_09805 [Ignavibacteria bacterium]